MQMYPFRVKPALAALLCVLGAATPVVADPPSPYSVTVDVFNARAPNLNTYQANDRTWRVTFQENGATLNLTGATNSMSWFTSAHASSVVYASSNVVDAANGIVDFSFTAANLNTNGTFYYEMAIENSNRYMTAKQGKLKIRPSPPATGVSAATFASAINFDNYLESGTISNVTLVGDGSSITGIDHGTGMAAASLLDDDHTIYRLESEDHTHASTGMQAGQLDHGSAITGLGDDDHALYLQNTEISTSSELAGLLDNETGSGLSVFATSPTLTTPSVATSLTVTDEDWIGLASDAGRIKYDNETVDVLSVLTANMRVGAGTPTIATGADDLYATGDIESDATLVVAGVAYLGDDIQLQDDKGIGISGGPEIEFDDTGTAAIELLGANVRIGNGTPGTATGLEDLYVESDIELDGTLIGTPYCNKVVATHGATDDPTFLDAGTITDGDFVDLIWDTEVSDVDGVLAADGTSIQFTRTGWAVITASYQIEANNNSEIYYRLVEDGTEYILFAKTPTEGQPSEGWCRTIQIPITDASKVYKFQMCINTSDGSTDYPTGQGSRLHIILWPDS